VVDEKGNIGEVTNQLKINGSFDGGNLKVLQQFFIGEKATRENPQNKNDTENSSATTQKNSSEKKPRVVYFGDEIVSDIWVPAFYSDWDLCAIVEELEGIEHDQNVEQ
jgi:hypothetical protein